MQFCYESGQRAKDDPRAIAEEIVEKWEKDAIIEKLEVAGPGFINITLSKELTEVARDPRLGVPPLTQS